MNRNEAITVCLGLVLAAIVLLGPVACSVNRQNQIVEAIKAGADPTEAKCAIESAIDTNPACVIVATRKKEARNDHPQ